MSALMPVNRTSSKVHKYILTVCADDDAELEMYEVEFLTRLALNTYIIDNDVLHYFYREVLI